MAPKPPLRPCSAAESPAQPTLLDAAVEALALKNMGSDYLCPGPSRRWARLHLAVAHWHRLNTVTNSQGALAKFIGVRASQLSKARNPPASPAAQGNALAEEFHVKAATQLGVNADWLVHGFSPDGADVWPTWTDSATQSGRTTIEAVFNSFLDDHIAGEPVPAEIHRVLVGEPQYSLAPSYKALPDHIGQGSEHINDLRLYLIQHHLSIDAYLGRFRAHLRRHWNYLRTSAAKDQGTSSHLQAYGIAREQIPDIPRNRWIFRHFPLPV